MILGQGVENITICGPGTIDGGDVRDAQGEERMRGPHTLVLGHCRGVTLDGLTFARSANYAVLLESTDQVDCRNVSFRGGWDGVHIRGIEGQPCRRITISHCDFQTGDDAIAGWYWDDVVVSNCLINSSCNGIRVIGPATNLIIHNCLFFGPGRYPHITQGRHNMLAGILIQPGAWDRTPGETGSVLISNVSMRSVECALSIVTKADNTCRDVVVEGLRASDVYRSAISVEAWGDHPLEDITLRDVHVQYAARSVSSAAVDLEPPHVGIRPLPAWGLFAYRVKRPILEQLHLSLPPGTSDARPRILLRE
jgi:polygalacturonase